jgi:hypothetical protein
MAVEALTKAKIRSECVARGLPDAASLARSLGVELKNLDATIRLKHLLQDDDECYTKGKEASDAFEHGYRNFDHIFALAHQVRRKMAAYVRSSIFDIAMLESDAKAKLLSKPFNEPLGHWPVAKYLRGTLKGGGQNLPVPGARYPFMRWATEIKKCEVKADGTLQMDITEKMTAELGEGITFSPKSLEAWKQD